MTERDPRATYRLAHRTLCRAVYEELKDAADRLCPETTEDLSEVIGDAGSRLQVLHGLPVPETDDQWWAQLRKAMEFEKQFEGHSDQWAADYIHLEGPDA